MESLSGCEFTYETYNPELLLEIPKQHIIDLVDFLMKVDKYAIGYCDGSLLEYRPRTHSYGVMFQYKEFRFWLHVAKEWLDKKNEILLLTQDNII